MSQITSENHYTRLPSHRQRNIYIAPSCDKLSNANARSWVNTRWYTCTRLFVRSNICVDGWRRDTILLETFMPQRSLLKERRNSFTFEFLNKRYYCSNGECSAETIRNRETTSKGKKIAAFWHTNLNASKQSWRVPTNGFNAFSRYVLRVKFRRNAPRLWRHS